jgi:hypothetical protein
MEVAEIVMYSTIVEDFMQNTSREIEVSELV